MTFHRFALTVLTLLPALTYPFPSTGCGGSAAAGPAYTALDPVEDPETVTRVIVKVWTTTDDKEDSQFEFAVKQGANVLFDGKHGAGQDWNDGDYREFSNNPGAKVDPAAGITVMLALQDGDWGRNNHWECHIVVELTTSKGRQVTFDNNFKFITDGKSRDERNLDPKKWP